MAPTPETTALLRRLMQALDYAALGEIYCDEGGDRFWEERREVVVDLGLSWAAELSARLRRGGRSLYVGAGVAELPALLTEVCDLGRQCVVTSLREPECATLNASLAAVGLDGRLSFEARDAGTLGDGGGEGGFDHLSVVSVLDDPETYPWVSDVTYGRASALDLDVAAFEQERQHVRALVAKLCASLSPPALVTTTFEEAAWILEGAEAAGLCGEGDDTMVETALVGDPIGFLTLSEAKP